MKEYPSILALLALFALAIAPVRSLFGQSNTLDQSRSPANASANDSSEKVVNLSPFTVSGSANVGYGATQSSSARLGQSYTDTPQMISTVTAQFLKDTLITNSRDALKYVPNVHNFLNVSAFGTVGLRGLTTGTIYTDGFSDNAAYNIDVGFADRIEIVKGPSAASFGQGNPAGFINYATKVPTFNHRTSVSGTIGDSNNGKPAYRALIDYDSLVGNDSLTGVRIVAISSAGTATQDWSDYRRYGVMAAAKHIFSNKRGSWLVNSHWSKNTTPATEGNATLVDTFQKNASRVGYASVGSIVPDFPVLPADFAVGFEGLAMDEDVKRTSAILDYQLSDSWRIRQAGSVQNSALSGEWIGYDAGNVTVASNGTFLIAPRVNQKFRLNRYFQYQSDAVWKGETPSWGAKHVLLLGGDLSRGRTIDANEQVIPPPRPLFNVNRANPYVVWPVGLDRIGTDTYFKNHSVYIQAQEMLFSERLTFTAAARKNYSRPEILNRSTQVKSGQKTVTPLLPTYSILYKVNKLLSAYVLYTESASPLSVVARYGGFPSTDPRAAETMEVQPTTILKEGGIKGALLDGQFTFALSYFDVRSEGARLQVASTEILPNGTLTQVNRGFLSEQEVRGVEFEGFGQISEKLTFMLGGAFNSSSQVQPIGSKIYKVPLFNLQNSVYGYASYSLGKSRREGLTFTAGWKTILRGWNVNTNAAEGDYRYPDNITTVDIGAFYSFGRNTVGLKANNLFHSESLPTTQRSVTPGRQLFATFETRL